MTLFKNFILSNVGFTLGVIYVETTTPIPLLWLIIVPFMTLLFSAIDKALFNE